MAEPKLVLLDEPTAGVNPTLQNEIGERLLELPQARHHRAADRARHGLHRPALRSGHRHGRGPGADRGHVRRGARRPSRCAKPISGGGGMSLLDVADLRGGYGGGRRDRARRGAPGRAGRDRRADRPERRRQVDLAQADRRACCGRAPATSASRTARSPAWRAPDISRLGLAFVPQERNVFGTMTVRREPRDGRLPRSRRRCGQRMDELYAALSDAGRQAACARPAR